MPASFERWTVDLLDALPESHERFELIDGELYVTPSPNLPHQRAILELTVALRAHARQCGYELLISPSDVRKDPIEDNRVQPDLYVVMRGSARDRKHFLLSELVLAIEITSPSRPWYDYEVKRDLYLHEGVGEYWVVNLDRRDVTRWRAADAEREEGEVLTDRVEWRAPGALEPVAVDLRTFFAEAGE